MYKIEINHRFFFNGYAFPQLIGFEDTLYKATDFINKFVIDNPQFKNHDISAKEITLDELLEMTQ